MRDLGADSGAIIGVANQDGEIVEFETIVDVTYNIEHWLKRVEHSMKFSVAATL